MNTNSHELPTNLSEILEIRNNVQNIRRLLRLDENLGLTSRIKPFLLDLGLNKLDEFYEFNANFELTIQKRLMNPPTPNNYPSLDEFRTSIIQVVNERIQPKEAVSPVKASDLAIHSWTSWLKLKGRGGKPILQYSYDLGKIICDPLLYSEITPETDEIEVADNFKIKNGQHRCLVLKTLGYDLVKSIGLDRWVKVDLV